MEYLFVGSLAFILGFIICRVFYFTQAAIKSIRTLQHSQLIALLIITRAIESFQYAHDYKIATMSRDNESEHNVNAFKICHNEELAFFKRKSISQIINSHGNFFKEVVEFNDWKTAMIYLEANRNMIIDFLAKEV